MLSRITRYSIERWDAWLRFEYVSNAETCRKFPRRNRGTRRRPRGLTKVRRHPLQCECIKTNFCSGRIAREGKSVESFKLRTIDGNGLFNPRIPLLSLFFSFFIFAITLCFTLFLTQSLSIIVSQKLFFYFSTDYQLRESVSPSLYVSHLRVRPLKIFLWELYSRFTRSIKE